MPRLASCEAERWKLLRVDAAAKKTPGAESIGMANLIEAAYLAIAFVVFVVTLGVGASVLAGVQAGQTANSYAANASGYGLVGINNIANQSGVIGTLLAASIMLGLLMTAFVMKRD